VTKLDGLKWSPKWTTHLGCIKGCLDYLEVNITDAWLFGASGHAFVLNIHEQLCPSGPTAWKTQRMHTLAQNVGCRFDGVVAQKGWGNFQKAQVRAWDTVRAALAKGLPCYGWELEIAEYYVITGHDDTGYFYQGPLADEGKGPLPWQKLGESEIGWIEIFSVQKADAPSDADAVKAALKFAVAYGRDASEWTHDHYAGGLAAYDLWIDSLAKGAADGFGLAYNAVVWAECRKLAPAFLREAKGRLPRELAAQFDEAIAHYDVVAKQLEIVAQQFPFLNVSNEQKVANAKDPARVKAALEALRTAKAAEDKGLTVLESLLKNL